MYLKVLAGAFLVFASSGGALCQEKSTICQFNSGPRAGEIEDWGRLIGPTSVGKRCNDKAGSLGFFISRHASQARSAVRITSWPGKNGNTDARPPSRAVEDEWAPYTDRYNLIHTKRVEHGEPSTNNGLIYTAYACVTMQLRNMSYKRREIADAIKRSQVKPGLFGRGPSQLDNQNAHDDYWGLGALDGICGFHHVANDILAYGRGHDQSSGSTVAGLQGADVGSMGVKFRQCTTIPYNYNNVSPGQFTWPSWFGRYPALITHWKIAAGSEQPTSREFAFWAATLILSGKTAKRDDTNSWLRSWLQVLTYQMSKYRSVTADYAVNEWWKRLHAQYPAGGIKQVMKQYLAAEAEKHPLGKYIDDFEKMRNPNAKLIDKSNATKDMIDPLQNILTQDCGSGIATACFNYKGFSPENFLAPFTAAIATADAANDAASKALAEHQNLIENPAPAVQTASKAVDDLNAKISQLEMQRDRLRKDLQDKKDLLSRIAERISPPGACWESPCKICPKRPVPCGLVDNPEYKKAKDVISIIDKQFFDVSNDISNTQYNLQVARKDLANKASKEFRLLERRRLQGELAKVRGALQVAKGANSLARDIVANIQCPSLPLAR